METGSLFAKVLGTRLRGVVWKWWYQHLAKSYRKDDWRFMNYGYAPLEDPPDMIPLEPADATDRYCIQLYHHVASAIDLSGLEVLEIGSGRGGGADYVKRYLKPKSMVGVDFAKDAVDFCNQKYSVNGLTFKVGNAEALPFADNSFDAVINVESSHCYPSVDKFLAQVKRVLREDGYFLFADIRIKEGVEPLRAQLHNSGLRVLRETNISPNVVRALHLDNDHRTAFIKETVKESMVDKFSRFAGVESSPVNRMLKNGDSIYMSCVMQNT